MATLKIKNLNKINTQIRKQITKAARSPQIRAGIAEIVVDQIQKEPIPVTSKATKIWRKYLEQRNNTDKAYNRNLINITFTGDLLKDLAKSIKASIGAGKIEYILQHTDKKHKKYKKPNGKSTKGEAKSFKFISNEIIKKGYNYLVFSKKSNERVLKFFKENIFKQLK